MNTNTLDVIGSHNTSTTSTKVSINDAIAMASVTTKVGATGTVIVEPVVSKNADTLMFFVNYEDGWQILSADKRTPMLIASSDSGHISLSIDNCGLLFWLQKIAKDMNIIIGSEDSSLNFTSEQIASHINAWVKLTNDAPSRGGGDLPPPEVGPGVWLVVGIDTEEVYYDHVNHLLYTHWIQRSPCNYYCPPKTSGSGKKPAGCTPVAGGQMLQYLYSVYGSPTSFSYDGMTGFMSNLNLGYNTNPGYLTTALLLRHIGNEVGAIYGNNATSVLFPMSRLKDFFSSKGYSCTKQSYSVDKVKQNLLNNMPIVVGGYPENSLGLPDYSNGHSFIIDGYRRYRTKTTYYYERVYGNPPIYEYKSEVIYSTPHISDIKMNWGWIDQWTSGINDGWFALTGDWYVDSDDTPGVDTSYTEDISILCDFNINS